MHKKCIICNEDANFAVKGTSDFYCPQCAEENFGDVSLLVAIEDQAKLLKEEIERTGEKLQIDEIPQEKIDENRDSI